MLLESSYEVFFFISGWFLFLGCFLLANDTDVSGVSGTAPPCGVVGCDFDREFDIPYLKTNFCIAGDIVSADILEDSLLVSPVAVEDDGIGCFSGATGACFLFVEFC